MHDKTTVTHWDGHQMYIQGYSVHTHTSHTDFSTDLSWDGQSRPNPVAAVEEGRGWEGRAGGRSDDIM